MSYILASALLIEGVSRNRNALIDGNTENYDWESGYTCHQIGSGCITIQLAQPYIIGSMRYPCFLLGNEELRAKCKDETGVKEIKHNALTSRQFFCMFLERTLSS